jgi:hypothetical protein
MIPGIITDCMSNENALEAHDQNAELWGYSESERTPYLENLVSSLRGLCEFLKVESCPAAFNAKELDFDPYLRDKLYTVRKQLGTLALQKWDQPEPPDYVVESLADLCDAYAVHHLKEKLAGDIDNLRETYQKLKKEGISKVEPLLLTRLAQLNLRVDLTEEERYAAAKKMILKEGEVSPKVKRIISEAAVNAMKKNLSLNREFKLRPQSLVHYATR